MTLIEYLQSLGGSTILIDKAKILQNISNEMCPETIEDYFVTEYMGGSDQRVFLNLWFFSPKYVLESKNVLSNELNIDITCTFNNIDRFEITAIEYDPTQPETTIDKSNLTIEGSASVLGFHLQASKTNCTKLWFIFKKYLLPNLAEFVEILSE